MNLFYVNLYLLFASLMCLSQCKCKFRGNFSRSNIGNENISDIFAFF